MPAYELRMPAGIAGEVTRLGASHLEPAVVGDTAIPHGSPVKLSDAALIAIEAGDAASLLYGFLARSFPTQGDPTTYVDGSASPGAVVDVLRRGYMSVPLASGTAAKNGQVYVRVQTDGEKALGDIEADADPAVLSIEGAAGENTGNGTIGGLAVEDGAKVGDYEVVFTAATAFDVTDPDGLIMASGSTGTEFSAAGVTFTITAGGTAFEADDAFTVTVSATEAGNVAIPAEFMGAADADGNVEIAYNI